MTFDALLTIAGAMTMRNQNQLRRWLNYTSWYIHNDRSWRESVCESRMSICRCSDHPSKESSLLVSGSANNTSYYDDIVKARVEQFISRRNGVWCLLLLHSLGIQQENSVALHFWLFRPMDASILHHLFSTVATSRDGSINLFDVLIGLLPCFRVLLLIGFFIPLASTVMIKVCYHLPDSVASCQLVALVASTASVTTVKVANV